MLLTFLLFLLHAQYQTHAKPVAIKQLENSGILLEELGSLHLYHDTWNIFTEINIEEMLKYVENIKELEQKFEILCQSREDHCYSQVKILQKMLTTLKERTGALSDLVGKKRGKRSLFNGIGNGLHYLFGVMDNGNEEEIYSRLKNIEEDQKALLELEKNQITVVKTTFEKLQIPLKNLKENQAKLAQSIEDLRYSFIDNLQVQTIISALNLELLDIEFYQQTLLDIITSLSHNQIHPLLISPSQLLEIYRKISNNFKPTNKDLEILLKTIEIKTKIMNGTLVARIILPRPTFPVFTLQKIHLLPVFHENYSLVLDVDSEYVASNTNTQQFTLLKQDTFNSLKKFNINFTQIIYVGKLTTVVYEQEVAGICPLNFVFNPFNEPNPCKYLVKQKGPGLLTKLSRRNSWLYALPQTLKVQSLCREGISSIALKGTGLLTLKQPCHFQVNKQIIYFEGQDTAEIKISQPILSRPTQFNLSENLAAVLNNSTKNPPKEVTILKEVDSNRILRQNTITLEALETKLIELDEKRKMRTLSHHLPITSISLSSILVIILIGYVSFSKISNWVKQYRGKRNPHASQSSHSTDNVLQDLPRTDHRNVPSCDTLPPTKNVIPVD